MNISNRCWNVLLNESAQNGVFIDANSKPISYATLNLDSIEDKIQYLFKYSPYHVLLSKTSIIDFASKVPGAIEILSTLCSTKNLNICSISSGLGEDLIGFLGAVNELKLFQKGSLSIGLVNKHESCCETAKNLFDAHSNFELCNSWEYIQCDPLTTWTTEAENYLAQTDAVFLTFPFVKYINKSSVFLKFMKDLFKYMKSGAIVFCFFQKKQDEYFRSKEFNSLILNSPLEVLVHNVPFNDLVLEIVGKQPILSGGCYLTVLKKEDSRISVSPSVPNELMTSKDESLRTLSFGYPAREGISESNQTVIVPENLTEITSSEKLLTSLIGSLKHMGTVLKKCKASSSSNSLLETESSKIETFKMGSLVNALLSLEESLKRLCYILRKCRISCSASSEQLAIKAAKDLNTLITNDMEDQIGNKDSNESISLLIQSLNNLIDKLEVQ